MARFGQCRDGMASQAWVSFDGGPVRGVLVGGERVGTDEYRGKKKRRFVVNFWTGTEMKILAGTGRLYHALVGLADKVADAHSQIISIKRTGTGENTQYVIAVIRAIAPAEEKRLQAEQVINLDEACPWLDPIEEGETENGPWPEPGSFDGPPASDDGFGGS